MGYPIAHRPRVIQSKLKGLASLSSTTLSRAAKSSFVSLYTSKLPHPPADKRFCRANRSRHAARVGAPLTGDIEGGAVINRRTHE